MTRPRRLLLASLSAAWVGMVLACCCPMGPLGTSPAKPSTPGQGASTNTKPGAQPKNENEIERDGLVLLWDTVKGTRGEFGGEITGTVVNRRDRKLGYVQIQFNLYDASGAQVGTALANINGLEPGGRWNFTATTFGKDFSRFKFSALTGF